MFDVTKLKNEDLETILKAAELIRPAETKSEEPKQIELEEKDMTVTEFTANIRLNLPKYQAVINDAEIEVNAILGTDDKEIDEPTMCLIDTLCRAVWNLRLYIKAPMTYCGVDNPYTPYTSMLERIDKLCGCINDVIQSANMGYDVIQQIEPLTANEDLMEWDCPEDSSLIFGESFTDDMKWNDIAKNDIETAVSKAFVVLDNSSFTAGTAWRTRFEIMANQIASYLGLTSLNGRNRDLVPVSAALISQSICSAWDYSTSIPIMMITIIADRMEDEFNLLHSKYNEHEEFSYNVYAKEDFFKSATLSDNEADDLEIDIPKDANFFSDMYESESVTEVKEGRADDVIFPDTEDSEYGNDEIPTEVGTPDKTEADNEQFVCETKTTETEIIPEPNKEESVEVESVDTNDGGFGVESRQISLEKPSDDAVFAALKSYVRSVYRVLQAQNVGDFQDIACVNTMNAYVTNKDIISIKNHYAEFSASFNKIGRLSNSGGKIPESYDALVKSIEC